MNDLMQQGYVYQVEQPLGATFIRNFQPELTPSHMLKLGSSAENT